MGGGGGGGKGGTPSYTPPPAPKAQLATKSVSEAATAARENQKEKFTPQAVTPEKSQEENMTEFVLEPLYTQKEIRDFRKKNEQNGKFTVTKDTVKSIEDLEKLFMVWQHATESADSKAQIEVAQEMENEAGFRFSKLTIEGVESDG